MRSLKTNFFPMALATGAIVILGIGYRVPVVAQATTSPALPVPPVSEGNAKALSGTLAKDGSVWLGGVGGDGDIEATETSDYPYEITPDTDAVTIDTDTKALSGEFSPANAQEGYRYHQSVPLSRF